MASSRSSSLSVTPTTGKSETSEGTFTIEGDKIYATVGQGVPMVLMFVNGTYQSTWFGLPMKFVKHVCIKGSEMSLRTRENELRDRYRSVPPGS